MDLQVFSTMDYSSSDKIILILFSYEKGRNKKENY